MRLSETFLEIARGDLDAARCLYEREMYAQAVFYLQQSVEKATKSLAIMTKVLNASEAGTRVVHNPLIIYKMLLDRQRYQIEVVNKVLDAIGELREVSFLKDIDVGKVLQDLHRSQQFLDPLTRKRPSRSRLEELICISSQRCRQYIEELKELETQVEEFAQSIPLLPVTDAEFGAFREQFLQFVRIAYKDRPEEVGNAERQVGALDASSFKELVRAVLLIVCDLRYVAISLLVLSLVTFPHAIIARYPVSQFNPLELYKKDLPLVELFEDYLHIVDKVLGRLRLRMLTDGELGGLLAHLPGQRAEHKDARKLS